MSASPTWTEVAVLFVVTVSIVAAIGFMVKNSDKIPSRLDLVKEVCSEASLHFTGHELDFARVKIMDQSGYTYTGVKRYELSDPDTKFRCLAEASRGRTFVASLVVDGEDRTQDYRLKEQN